MFTREEALQFAENTLSVHNVPERLNSDRRGLLDDVTTGLQIHIPFNNLKLMSVSRDERRRPSLEEIKSDVLSGIGGLCYTLNIALFYLLKALGFDVLASVACPSRDTHVLVHVRNVKRPGDTFLVDAGLGFPQFRAVSLDCDETPVFKDSFLEYKFVRRDGQLLRLHGQGDIGGRHNLQPRYLDGWRVMYSADLKGTENIEEFLWHFDQVFNNRLQLQDPLITKFHSVFRLQRYPNKRAVMISNNKLMVENQQGELEVSVLEGGDTEILEVVRRYFPSIPQEMARRALHSCKEACRG